MNNILLKNIEKLPFLEANKVLLELCQKKVKLSLDEINFILNLDEKELINSFFDEYKLFTSEDFIFIEGFINKNLENINKDFVSDLIYFASDFGLDLDYKKIISFLIIYEEDSDCLVLSCLTYLNQNVKFLYIEEIVKNLEYIIYNDIYHQNEQLFASLILFRITQNSDYLKFIKELLIFDDCNLEFLQNILNLKMYNKRYFNFNNFNKVIKI